MDLSILAPVGAVVALLFAFFLSRRVMKADEGTDLMKKIAGAVRKGANAYLNASIPAWLFSSRLCSLSC